MHRYHVESAASGTYPAEQALGLLRLPYRPLVLYLALKGSSFVEVTDIIRVPSICGFKVRGSARLLGSFPRKEDYRIGSTTALRPPRTTFWSWLRRLTQHTIPLG